jgi:hypothetical protein
LTDDPLRIMPHLYDILRSAGIPEEAFNPASTFGKQSLSHGDPDAGSVMDSAHRLTEVTLKALQFSRWRNYDLLGDPSYKPDLGMSRKDYAAAIGTIVGRFGEPVVIGEVNRLTDDHLNDLHTALHTPGLIHKPHSDGRAKDEEYMHTADKVIRSTHRLADTMYNAGNWVNFLSIFGDADFWAVTRSAHPDVFNATVDHILGLPDPYEQPKGMYGVGALISPVGLIRSYFTKAYDEITTARSDFRSDVKPEEAITIRW